MTESPAVVIQPQGSITRGHAERAVKLPRAERRVNPVNPTSRTQLPCRRRHRRPGQGCIGHPAFRTPSQLRGRVANAHTSDALRRENAQTWLFENLARLSSSKAAARARLRQQASRRQAQVSA